MTTTNPQPAQAVSVLEEIDGPEPDENDDPMCKCGHRESEHDSEDVCDFCGCDNFALKPAPAGGEALP